MDYSFFTMPVHPTSRDYTETLQEDRRIITLADELGFKEAFVGEHVTDLAENVPSSTVFLASLIDCTERIVLGTGTGNLPNHHPARVAAEIAMLDHLLKSPLMASPMPLVMAAAAPATPPVILPASSPIDPTAVPALPVIASVIC